MEEKKNKATEQEETGAKETENTQHKSTAGGNQEKKKDTPRKKTSAKKKSGKEAKIAEELNEAREKLAEIHDKYLRLSAEYDNYRRRTLKEKMELTKTGGEQVLMNILPVMDNLERAMSAIEQAKEIEAVKTGIELIVNKFYDYMEQNGVKEIPAMEAEFDTDLHEAITKIPTEKEELKGKVVDVVEKGYYLHDKVIRYAKVVVGE